jgi:hypothetical protein
LHAKNDFIVFSHATALKNGELASITHTQCS